MGLSAASGPAAPSLSAAVLRPVRSGNAFESTVEQLAMMIRLGVFVEGERLPPERELAERLRIGRATLREAISALRAADMVRTRRGRTGGSVVTYRGPVPRELQSTVAAHADRPALARPRRAAAEVADALAFRAVVEPGAASLAAAAALSADEQAWLRTALRQSVEVVGLGARRVADSRLHLAIATLSGSPRLIEAVSQARSLTADLLADLPLSTTEVARSQAQHAEVVDAVLTGDQARAQTVMSAHCEATSLRVRALL